MGTTKDDFFLLEKLYHNCHIPVCIYKNKQKIACIPEISEKADIFRCDEELLWKIREAADRKSIPIIFMDEIYVVFGTFKDEQGRYYIWGPFTLTEQDAIETEVYKHRHHIYDKNCSFMKSSIETIANIMSIAYYYYCGRKVDEEDIYFDLYGEEKENSINSVKIEEYQLAKSEDGWIHDTFEYENKFVEAVVEGNVTEIKRLMQVDIIDRGIGVVAEDEFKQIEYLCVSSVILVSRAAVKGGMNPEEAYELADVYLQRLEKCKSREEFGGVCPKMALDFTERVRQAKNRKAGNIYVEKSKDYIAKHLRKPFKIGEMAEELDVNSSYLSRIFSEQEGMTVQQYISREKCSHAANMLQYTDYSISIISEYFCFASQSHFGKQFKDIYGMTPNEYRKKNRKIGLFIK